MHRTIALVIVVALLSLPMPAAAGDAGDFVSRINTSRAAAGLPAVAVDAGLAAAAADHSVAMAAAGAIYHSGGLAAGAPSGWEALSENVGAGPSVDSLHAAFMASAGHRANVMGDYDYVGVGVVRSESGQLWVTVRFVRKAAAPAPAADAGPAAPLPTTPAAATPVAAAGSATPSAAAVSAAAPRRGSLRVGRALHLPIAD